MSPPSVTFGKASSPDLSEGKFWGSGASGDDFFVCNDVMKNMN